MALTDLPFELLCAIVFDALSVHPRSSAVLCVNKAFYSIGQAHLHTYLSFRSAPQIATFGQDNTPLACIPRTLSVQLSGGTADFYTFDRLFAVFLRCQLRHVDSETAVDGLTPPLMLESLSFCLHSHTRNPRLHIIQAALALVDPMSFSWTGPDPEHHFSTAIVPEAAHHLFKAVARWQNLRYLHLTHLSIGEPPVRPGLFGTDDVDAAEVEPANPLFACALPALETLHLGQATFVPPRAVAATLALDMPALTLVRLVDVYEGSIWGRSMRRSCVERAAAEIPLHCADGDAREEATPRMRQWLLERVQSVVVCEAKTERFMGGDRAAEGSTILL